MVDEINNLTDVESFIKQLVEEGTNVHPDDDFKNYIKTDTGEATYSPEKADFRNHLMHRCFRICEGADVDLYDLVQKIFLIETGLDEYIPLPSQV